MFRAPTWSPVCWFDWGIAAVVFPDVAVVVNTVLVPKILG